MPAGDEGRDYGVILEQGRWGEREVMLKKHELKKELKAAIEGEKD